MKEYIYIYKFWDLLNIITKKYLYYWDIVIMISVLIFEKAENYLK